MITNKRITVITGPYGSGKTEISINFIMKQSKLNDSSSYSDFNLVDLDFVNPYFRSREAKELLNSKGVRVVSSAEDYFNADVPALSPQISGVLRNPSSKVIVDLGGDETGARAIGRFKSCISEDQYEMHFVLNPYRPFSSTFNEIRDLIILIENASRLKVSSIISNPNLAKGTTVQHIVSGHERVKQIAEALNIPVSLLTVEDSFLQYSEISKLSEKVISIKRIMKVPWED